MNALWQWQMTALVAAAICASFPAAAQQSFYNPSAAQPSTGVTLVRQTYEYVLYGDDPSGLDRDIEELRINTQLALGLTKELALIAEVPLLSRWTDTPSGDDSHDLHFGDLMAMFKLRIWQRDTGPLYTMRLSLLAGTDFPTGKEPFGNGGFDPMIGAVFTSIQGRHGVNLALRYRFTTHQRDRFPVGPGERLADLVQLDAAYLYRLFPAAFEADAHAAWYAVIELNGLYEFDGDREVRLAPGIMYEARNWVVEASIQVPVFDDLDHRPERDIVFGLGVRLLF